MGSRLRRTSPRLTLRGSPWMTLPASAAIAFALLVAPAFAATTVYVDNTNPACSDTGPGTEAQPYCTISAAIAANKGAGVTVFVKPGIYRESVSFPASGAAGNPFVLQSLGGLVVVDGADDFS